MKQYACILLLVILALALIPPASADTTLIFRDMSILPSQYQSMHIFEVNSSGTWDLGLYNSSADSVILETGANSSSVFILQYVPTTADFWSSPLLGIEQFLGWNLGHYPDLLAVFFIFCLFCIAFYLVFNKEKR